MIIPVIDLFAGPGGLGEGFSSLRDDTGQAIFRIRLSVEKDHSAHKTLELRSFFRQFPDGEVPEDYYRYIRKEGISRAELFERYPSEAGTAQREAWRFELAKEHAQEIDDRIREALNGETTWVLIGGPPCQAYSVVGRVRMCGNDREKYENDPRHYLYREYLRILATHQPPVFVMENVPGLMSSQANGEGIFARILSDLSLPQGGGNESGYKLYPLRRSTRKVRHSDFVIHAEKHGIPQRRHRLIVVGIRSDLCLEPEQINTQQSISTVRDAIQDLPRVRSGLSKEQDTYAEWSRVVKTYAEELIVSKSTTEDLRQQFEAVCTNHETLTLGGEFLSSNGGTLPSEWLQHYSWWFQDERLQGFCNHSARSHIRRDIGRYLYAACYAKARKTSPRIRDFPEDLRPAHRNIGDAAAGKLFSDRFRVQLADNPAISVSKVSRCNHATDD
jgi:DNA (cytosine-5)-methyltransferase 1